MSLVVGVRFADAGKLYYYDPGTLELEAGDYVLVETPRGMEMGEVVLTPHEVEDTGLTSTLQQVSKRADEKDFRRLEQNVQREQDAFQVCEEKIRKRGLPMKLIDVEYAFDGSKLIFYFAAEGRVDFRELVKDLASVFRTRIELRQIGVRDEAKKIGGLGPCGRPACCNAFLDDFAPVSIKMAKEQNLSLSPTKISGLCGRLMCCLHYEHEHYRDMHRKLPRIGSFVQTSDGPVEVVDTDPLGGRIKGRVTLPDGSVVLKKYALDELGEACARQDVKVHEQRQPAERHDLQERSGTSQHAAQKREQRRPHPKGSGKPPQQKQHSKERQGEQPSAAYSSRRHSERSVPGGSEGSAPKNSRRSRRRPGSTTHV